MSRWSQDRKRSWYYSRFQESVGRSSSFLTERSSLSGMSAKVLFRLVLPTLKLPCDTTIPIEQAATYIDL